MKWIKCSDELPDVPIGMSVEVIVSVYRNHGNKSYSFSAYYLNQMEFDDDLVCSGWHHQFKHDNYDEYYEPIHLDDGDLVTHWMPLPNPPKD